MNVGPQCLPRCLAVLLVLLLAARCAADRPKQRRGVSPALQPGVSPALQPGTAEQAKGTTTRTDQQVQHVDLQSTSREHGQLPPHSGHERANASEEKASATEGYMAQLHDLRQTLHEKMQQSHPHEEEDLPSPAAEKSEEKQPSTSSLTSLGSAASADGGWHAQHSSNKTIQTKNDFDAMHALDPPASTSGGWHSSKAIETERDSNTAHAFEEHMKQQQTSQLSALQMRTQGSSGAQELFPVAFPIKAPEPRHGGPSSVVQQLREVSDQSPARTGTHSKKARDAKAIADRHASSVGLHNSVVSGSTEDWNVKVDMIDDYGPAIYVNLPKKENTTVGDFKKEFGEKAGSLAGNCRFKLGGIDFTNKDDNVKLGISNQRAILSASRCWRQQGPLVFRADFTPFYFEHLFFSGAECMSISTHDTFKRSNEAKYAELAKLDRDKSDEIDSDKPAQPEPMRPWPVWSGKGQENQCMQLLAASQGIRFNLSTTVDDMKREIAKKWPCEFPEERQMFVDTGGQPAHFNDKWAKNGVVYLVTSEAPVLLLQYPEYPFKKWFYFLLNDTIETVKKCIHPPGEFRMWLSDDGGSEAVPEEDATSLSDVPVELFLKWELSVNVTYVVIYKEFADVDGDEREGSLTTLSMNSTDTIGTVREKIKAMAKEEIGKGFEFKEDSWHYLNYRLDWRRIEEDDSLFQCASNMASIVTLRFEGSLQQVDQGA